MGLDILCFHTDKYFAGPWDNVQCKRYACLLQPAQVYVELGKIIYYSFMGEYPPPKRYFFAASKGVGLKLKKLLTNPDVLKKEMRANWDKHCKRRLQIRPRSSAPASSWRISRTSISASST